MSAKELISAMGGKRTLGEPVDCVACSHENLRGIPKLLWRPGMRLAIALLATLMFGYEGRALAQATNPSPIVVTHRDFVRRTVEVPPITTPPQCGVLNGPNSARGPGPVFCGVVPPAPNWMPDLEPKLTYQQKMQAAKRGVAGFDLNHDGVISRKEWSVMQARMVAPVPPRGRVQLMCATNQMFKLMDKKHDGRITFAEWTADNFGKDRQPTTGCS